MEMGTVVLVANVVVAVVAPEVVAVPVESSCSNDPSPAAAGLFLVSSGNDTLPPFIHDLFNQVHANLNFKPASITH